MKIATFNVNSVNARVDGLLPWLDRLRPDILLLQQKFPHRINLSAERKSALQ